MMQTCSQSPEPGQPTPANTYPEDRNLALKDSLGAALTKQGRYSEAAALLHEVLATRESLNQSPTSPGMLCTMNNLAAALHHQGDLASAETLHRRVLESDTQTLGISHANTLTAMHNLASVLAHQDPSKDKDKDNAKLSEAAELLQRALELSQQVNGPKSPSTLRMMGEQVNVLLRQEKYEQAERLATEVLALRLEVLRPQHPEIATAIQSLRVVLGKVGKPRGIRKKGPYRKRLGVRTCPGGCPRTEAGSGVPPLMVRSLFSYMPPGKVDEAEALRREERAIREINREEIADLRDGDGLVAMKEGRYIEAESIFREGLVT